MPEVFNIIGLDKFIKYLLVQKRYSPNTATAYKKDVEQFFTFFATIAEDVTTTSVKHIHIRSWVVDLASGKLSNRSINRKVVSLRSFFKFIQKTEAAFNNPCDKVQALKIPKRLPTVVKENEILNLYDFIFDTEVQTFIQWRDFIIIELLYNTGIRRAELIGIELSDLNLTSSILKVIGKGRKERLIPLNKQLVENLLQYLEFRNKEAIDNVSFLLLSDGLKKLYPKAVYNIVKKYLTLITTVEKKSPHVLRHSFATHLTSRGAELNAVKELLGHSSLAATQVYTHNSIEQLKNIYKKAHPKGE